MISEEELEKKMDEIADRSAFKRSHEGQAFWQLHHYMKDVFKSVLYKDLASPLNQALNPATSSGVLLDDYAAHWAGVIRKPAIKAIGKMRVFAERNINVAKDSVFKSASGVQFKVLESSSVDAPSGLVAIEALRAGSSYNLNANTKLVPERVLGGFKEAILEAGWQSQAGADEESDEEVRLRVKTVFADQASGDISEKYRVRAERIEGVRSAKIWRTPRGAGSADIVIASVDGTVTEDMIREVQVYLNEWGQVNWDVSVVPAELDTLEVVMSIENPDLTEDYVREVVTSYTLSLPINGIFDLKDLYARLNHGVNIISPVNNKQAREYSEWKAIVRFEAGSYQAPKLKPRNL